VKVLATSAALFFWLQAAVCAASGLGVTAREAGEGRSAAPSVVGTHHAATDRSAGHADHHGDGAPPADGEDHCRLIARALPATGVHAAPPTPGILACAVAVAPWIEASVSLSRGTSLRAPPRMADPVLWNRTLLI